MRVAIDHEHIQLLGNLWSACLKLSFTRAKLFILKSANRFVKTLISIGETANFKSPAQ